MTGTQRLQADVPANPGIQLQPDAQVQDLLDFRIQNFLRQAIIGYAVAQHSARFLPCIVNRDFVATAGHLVGKGQS